MNRYDTTQADDYKKYQDKYEELDEVGIGGMASVWMVRRREDGEIFAAKKDKQGFGQAGEEIKKL